jgi:hypothetical protein
MAWCQMQLAQLQLLSPPRASDFIPHLNRFEIPHYYRQLVYAGRSHQQTGQEPRLQLPAKPHGGYGWTPRQEVNNDLAQGREFEQEEGDVY